eukprot:TRINITY_DN6550_c0_g1_i2.p1 TRINITY_DN6550_c0_g1~~TRINITY_DN6550_c0_g1_i2.p1  ORF type:complete len:144 (+),score=5.60 TRINITY_DN6550_c0_g1_i2:828-1259(+)
MFVAYYMHLLRKAMTTTADLVGHTSTSTNVAVEFQSRLDKPAETASKNAEVAIGHTVRCSYLICPLLASKLDIGSVDHHHDVPTRHVGRVCGLVLSNQQRRYLGRQPPHYLILRIHQVPHRPVRPPQQHIGHRHEPTMSAPLR